MIVVDTNVIAYLYLPAEFTSHAEELLEQDPIWAAPILWRSEFRNVLTLFLHKKLLEFGKALQIQTEAKSLMRDNKYTVSSFDVMQLVRDSRCSAYDCEFVAPASSLGTRLVTMDRAILTEFPDTAVSLDPMYSTKF